MQTDLWVAIVVVLIPIVAVNAYFWRIERRDRRRARNLNPPQDAEILVNGACRPGRVVLRAGRPLRLHFSRTDDGEAWWDDLEFPYARIVRELPEGGRVTVDVRPLAVGEYTYFCAEGTKRGTLVIEDTNHR
jgi:plastocyanin domain-containing protein